MRQESTKQRILKSVLELVALKYTTNISIREIALHAKVNMASVNYHFRKKKSMMTELFKRMIDGFDRLLVLLEPNHLGAELLLVRWSDLLLRYLLLYPGVLVIVRESSKWEGIFEQVSSALERLQKYLDPLLIDLCGQSGEKPDEEHLGLRRSIFLGGLLQPVFPLNEAFDLRSRLRHAYFRRLYVIQNVRQLKNKLVTPQDFNFSF